MDTSSLSPDLYYFGAALVIVGGLVAGAVGFFLLIKILRWVERGNYNRDKTSMSESEHYYKWHKYDVNGDRDNW